MPLKVLDLFAGLEGWSTCWGAVGHETFSVDFDERFDVDLHTDIRWLQPDQLPWVPDVILASPPCEKFSVMNIGRHWTGPGDWPPHSPKTREAKEALELVIKTRMLIEALKPKFFVIENPVDKLRKLPEMADLERRTVWYCHYGETQAKPTDLWGGFPPSLELKPECHPQRDTHPDDCCCRDHAAAPRGSKTEGSVQGMTDSAERARIPFRLAVDVMLACERDIEAGRAHMGPLTLY